MTTEIDLLLQLKNQLVSFFDELIESFPNETDFIVFRIFIKDRIPITDIMKYICTFLCPLKKQVEEKDEKFFIEHDLLFDQFDEGRIKKVNHFKNLWLSPNVNDEDRITLWNWFQSFICIGNKYIEIINRNKNTLNK